jgi:hypothetical protein
MSWMPSADPLLGDKRSCDALELVVVPRVRDLGNGFAVRRAMPNEKRQMVGPFIFFDQMGPVQLLARQGMDVRHTPTLAMRPSPISSMGVSCIAIAKGTHWRLHLER